MKQIHGVTFLAVTVLTLVSNLFSVAAAAATTSNKALIYNNNNTSVMSTDQIIKQPAKNEDPIFGAAVLVSRSTSLIDFHDGTRSDGMDYLFVPNLKTYFGTFSSKITYSQNLHESDSAAKTKSDFADIPVTFAFNPHKWLWAPPYLTTLTPTITMVVPVSEISTKRDQLQTAAIAGLSFGIIPDGIAPQRDGAFNLAIGVTAGRNFYAYQENIDGDVLNQYSSNQTLNLGYTYKSFSFSTEYIHKSRWTFQGNTKEAFEFSQEFGYAVNDHFALAIGHTNAGSALKADGSEANFSVVNENDSTVYVQMGVSF